MRERVKSERGLVYVNYVKPVKREKIKREKKKPETVEDEKLKAIIAALEETALDMDRDKAYLKKVEGRYERYVRKNFPETLEARKPRYWEKWVNVAFMINEKLVIAKPVKKNSYGMIKIKEKWCVFETPGEAYKTIEYKGDKMRGVDFYKACVKTQTTMCDVIKLAKNYYGE